MLRLDKLIVTLGEWTDRDFPSIGNTTEKGVVEFDLKDYKAYHAGSIAREILRLGGEKYSEYPLDNLRAYVQSVIETTQKEVDTNASLVSRIEWPSGQSAWPSNDERESLTTEMIVVLVKVQNG